MKRLQAQMRSSRFNNSLLSVVIEALVAPCSSFYVYDGEYDVEYDDGGGDEDVWYNVGLDEI